MQGFQKVVGHQEIITHLQNAISMNKVSHAYLFGGENGSGKKMMASLFAMTLQCEKHGVEPCMECPSCKKAQSQNHPDIIYVKHEKPNTISIDEIREQLLSSPHSLFPVCRGELDEIIGIVRAKELLVALEEGVDVAAIASASPAIIVPETLDPINLLGVLRRARGSFVIVTNEFGVVQGLVTPLDVLEAIAGEFPDADETPEIITDGDGWLVKGGTDLHALQQALDVEHLADDDDIATVAGLVISANGHIPRVGDVIDVGPLHITIIEANDYRVDLVRIVKEQPAHDEDE